MTIAITASTRKTAIMRLFRHCGAGNPGAPVLLTVLMTGWTQLGLRGEDLSTGLNEMLEDGSLVLDTGDPKVPSVSLTAAGKAWFDGIGVDPRVRAEQERILAEVQRRAATRAPEAASLEPRWRIVDRRVQLD